MAGFNYLLSVTGDCSNTGAGVIRIQPSGGTPPYIVEFVNPSLGLGEIKTNLTSGNYLIRVNDSLVGVNNEFYINALVSSGGCLNVTSVSGTTCGNNNGSISLSGTSTSFPYTVGLYSGSTLIIETTSTDSTIDFSGIGPGIYRAYYTDAGGCSGYSESIIIQNSTQFDYGFFIVNNTSCFGNTGKLQITGATGVAPYTYYWYDGSTGNTITGLTANTYSVTVTDAVGCETTKSATIVDVPQLSVVSMTGSSPTCFSGDGTVTISVTGGTGPYYYSANNGVNKISYDNVVTLSGFTAGIAEITVTDSALCTALGSYYLIAPASLSIVGISTTNSTCSAQGGSITVNVLGNGPYSYTLVYPDSNTTSVTTNNTVQSFTSLSAGTYTIIVSNSSNCTYSQEVTIITEDKFNVNLSVTGTTCGLNNGNVNVVVGTGYTGLLDYILIQNGFVVSQYIDVPFSSTTLTSLSSGQYTLQVRDEDNCTVSTNFSISTSVGLNYSMASTDCGLGSGGTVTVSIFSGTPPFTIDWSSNVPIGQTGVSLTGLTGGTYEVTITDVSGCTESKSVVVPCSPFVSGYVTIPTISSGFTTTLNTKRDFKTMVNEGFTDLTVGHTNCVLSSTTYVAQVEISGNTYQQTFYTGTTLNDIPSDNLWVQTLEGIISGITGVDIYTLNLTTNSIVVKSECSGDSNALANSEFIVGLKINFDIFCET